MQLKAIKSDSLVIFLNECLKLEDVDGLFGLNLLTIIDTFNPIVKNFNTVKKNLIEKYGILNTENNTYTVEGDSRIEFENELCDVIEEDVDVKYKKLQMKEEYLSRIIIIPAILQDCRWIFDVIDEDKEEIVKSNEDIPETETSEKNVDNSCPEDEISEETPSENVSEEIVENGEESLSDSDITSDQENEDNK